MDKNLSIKEALKNVIEKQLLGTYRLALIELKNPKSIYFIKNSGDFVIGQNKQNNEIIVSSSLKLFSNENLGSQFTVTEIPNNHFLEVTDDCKFSFEKWEKKIQI